MAGRRPDEFVDPWGPDSSVDPWGPDYSRIKSVRSRRRAWVLAISSLAIVIVLAVVAYLYAPAMGTPSPTALNYSVASEVGALLSDCERRSSQTWRCEVSGIPGGSGQTVIYNVTMDGSRCWNGRSVRRSADFVEGGTNLKDPASGCVMLRDQLRLFSRIF